MRHAVFMDVLVFWHSGGVVVDGFNLLRFYLSAAFCCDCHNPPWLKTHALGGGFTELCNGTLVCWSFNPSPPAMANSLTVCSVDPHQFAVIIRNRIDNALILDSRSFLEYNASHVVNAVNVGCAKLMKRRLQQEKLCIKDFLAQNCHWEVDRNQHIIVYDQNTQDAKFLSPDSFMGVFLQKLLSVYHSVSILKGGFLEFQALYPNLCEDERSKYAPLTSLSQPCLPVTNHGPTRILPFLYLGSQQDALSKEALQHHNITYQLNVSTSCPKPDFIQESHFMRIPVIDNYSEKLLPHFSSAFQFLEKVRESGGCVLVHCLAGISRSATVAIAYVMKALKMTSDEAYRYVKSKRVTISPNFNFLGQLLEYEKQLQKECVLEAKPEPSTPLFNVSSSNRQSGPRSPSLNGSVTNIIHHNIQTLVPDSYCLKFTDISEIRSSKRILASVESSETTDFCASSNKSVTKNLDVFCIPEKQPLNFKCLPASSLKELSFTPCQTSSVKSSAKDEKINLATKMTSSSLGKILTYAASKRVEKKTESFSSETRVSDCKLDCVRLSNPTSPFLPSPGDLKSFDFGSKPYNRSDSVSTSGLGSEGSSDYADSWNDYNSSYERESDILMDEDYSSVPTEDDELNSRKILGFDDVYNDVSLYTKYDQQYRDNCHVRLTDDREYSRTVPCKSDKKYNAKYAEAFKYSSASPNSLHHHAFNSDELGRAHLLYRAQSCPGMLSSELGSSCNSNSDSLLNGVKLRQSGSAPTRKDKFRNRYSCSSIDYMDYSVSGMSHESCPDGLYLSSDSENSKMSSSHCSYRHSMIQVS